MAEGAARALLRRFGGFADAFADCFSRPAQRAAASHYLDALFNDSERKSMQAMHGRLGDAGSYEALQHFITDSPWARLRTLVPARTGILAIDDTSFPKQGTHSVGVKRQYCGALGKIANCQVAVSTVLLADQRAWPLSFELYLSQEWVRRCGTPDPRPHSRLRTLSRKMAHRLGPCAAGRARGLCAHGPGGRCRLRIDRPQPGLPSYCPGERRPLSLLYV